MTVLGSFLRMLRPRSARPPRTRDVVLTYDSSAAVDYETRAIAFFDVLGWKEAVIASASDPKVRKELLNIAWRFGARTREYVEEDTAENPSHDEYSQFSDSLIVSFTYQDARDLYRLLKFVTEFQTSMLLSGLPIRGGVTVGQLYHSGAVAFGPAMNEAYHLESRIAKYPRVIIDQNLRSDIRAMKLMLPKHWSFVIEDADGYFSTDFLTGFAMTIKLAEHIDRKMDGWLEEHKKNESVLPKYLWLKDRWLAAKKDAGWRVAIRDKKYAAFHESRARNTSTD